MMPKFITLTSSTDRNKLLINTGSIVSIVSDDGRTKLEMPRQTVLVEESLEQVMHMINSDNTRDGELQK